MRNTELSILVVVPMFLAVISATAFAEPPTPPPLPSGFNEFILSDQHKNAVLDIAKKTQSQIQGTCQTLGLSFTGKFAVFVPIQMGENGLPTSGIWKELVSATGCKESYFFNVLAVIDASHALSMVPLIPGDGLADPYLIRDAKPMVLQAVGLKKAGCDQKQVIRCRATNKLGIERQSGWEIATGAVTQGGRSPTGVTAPVAARL